jgi:hypothetical protein
MSISGETPRVVPVDDADELRADIVATRAELGDTMDRLVAKLDVKGRATHRVDEVRSAARDKVVQAKQAAPVPVRHALDRAGGTLAPVLEQVRPYRKQIALAVVGVLLVSVLAKRHAS